MSFPIPQNSSAVRFGDIVVERVEFTVYRAGSPCEMTPRAYDLLLYLVDNRDRVVEKQEIFDAVWKDTFVSDNALMRAVREIRRELGDSAKQSKYIETVHKRGYRFIGNVEEPEHPAAHAIAERPVNTAEPQAGGQTNYYKLGFLVLLAGMIAAVSLMIIRSGDAAVRSIAVMPLESSGLDAEIEHISDGIAESLINSLSELQDIRVVARATAFRYRGRESDPQGVGRELGVDAILTGRVVRTGDELTVQAELIDSRDGSQIWGSRYSRRANAIYELPGVIAGDLVMRLGLRLTGEQKKRLARNYTENSEAYRLYLLGRYFWNKRSEDALKKSIEYFQQAIEADPNYALAYAGLADSYAVMAISADLPAHEVFPKARLAAERALELDEGLAEAHATMLRIRAQYEWDWEGAEREYRRALELNPNYPMTHVYYLSYLVSVGRPDEAVTSLRRAVDLDPLSMITNAVMARALFFAGRYDEAIAASQKTLELDENIFLARLILGRSYARKGMYDEAITELEKARKLPGSVTEATSLLAHTLAVSGRVDEARKLLAEMERLSQVRYVQPYDLAMAYAGLGDGDAALDQLEMAFEHRNHQVPLIRAVPEFESIRTDPRFRGLVDRIAAGR